MHLKTFRSIAILFAYLIGMFPFAGLMLAQQPDASATAGCDEASRAIAKPSQLQSTPTFTAAIRLQANGFDIKVDTYTSVPCVVDWNQDGKKDLLVGCFYYGNVYLFLNSGTNAAPIFTTGSKLQADNREISVSYG